MWKTNCSYTWGLWVLQAFEMEEKVIFNCKLVTGSLMLALQCQKTQQPVATPRRTALGRAHAAARTVPPPRLRDPQRARDAPTGFAQLFESGV